VKLTGKLRTANLVYKPAVGYTVKSKANTEQVKVGQILTLAEVQALIDAGFRVHVIGPA
jgi:hypothetical protein